MSLSVIYLIVALGLYPYFSRRYSYLAILYGDAIIGLLIVSVRISYLKDNIVIRLGYYVFIDFIECVNRMVIAKSSGSYRYAFKIMLLTVIYLIITLGLYCNLSMADVYLALFVGNVIICRYVYIRRIAYFKFNVILSAVADVLAILFLGYNGMTVTKNGR